MLIIYEGKEYVVDMDDDGENISIDPCHGLNDEQYAEIECLAKEAYHDWCGHQSCMAEDEAIGRLKGY